MSRTAEIVTALSTVGCAIGIGFFMQSSDVADARYVSGELLPLTAENRVGTPFSRASPYGFVSSRRMGLFEVKAITHTSAGIPTPTYLAPAELLVPASISSSGENTSEINLLPNANQLNDSCPASVGAYAADAAMVTFEVHAPCFAGYNIVISHNGLSFAERLSGDGSLSLTFPALSDRAQITATFPNGRTEVVEAMIDAVPQFNRVVVQWEGDAGVQLHARELGADYGDAGHVWAGAPRDAAAIPNGNGGFLTVLGDPALPNGPRAEVYTFPPATLPSDMSVNLTVEAEVTQDNCGKRIRATALQFNAGKRVSAQELLLSMPGCDAVGHFLVLNNLLQDLTVASK